MQKHGTLLTAAYVLLLFTFNCTFPLQRDTSRAMKILYANQSLNYPEPDDNSEQVFSGETKNTLDVLEDLYNKLKKNATQSKHEARLEIRPIVGKHFLNEDDLRHYEQLVIMKKYPFLDIKELEMKLSPSSYKDRRHSVKLNSRVNIVPEPNICEPMEDFINVEISNRGLSGFAIPPQLVKNINVTERNTKQNISELLKTKYTDPNRVTKKSSDRNILKKLKDDINLFIEKRKRD